MKIGVDLDEVIVDFLPIYLKFHEQETGMKFTLDQFHCYNFWEIMGGDKASAIRGVDRFFDSEMFDELPAVSGAIETLNSLTHSKKIITARPANVKRKTEICISKYFPSFPLSDIIYSEEFTDPRKPKKSDICIEHGIEYMIEDNPKYALDCAEKGVTALLFDKPWNRLVSHPLIKRIYSWAEVPSNLITKP